MRRRILVILVAFLLGGIGTYLQPWFERQREALATSEHLAMQQAALEQYYRFNSETNARLASLLAQVPTAARVRVAFVRPPAVLGNLATGIRFDVTHALAQNGHAVGELVTDRPISDWADYLSDLLHNHCIYKQVADLTVHEAGTRLRKVGMVSFAACPIYNSANQMLGAVFVSWDEVVAQDAVKKALPLLEETARLIGKG